MTLMDNVLYGLDKDGMDEETGEKCYSEDRAAAVTEALSLAGLPVTGEDNQLDLQLSTRVGEVSGFLTRAASAQRGSCSHSLALQGGRTLSGGQRQRVAIARALVRTSDVYVDIAPLSPSPFSHPCPNPASC